MKNKHIGMVVIIIASAAFLAVAAQVLWVNLNPQRPNVLGIVLDAYSYERLLVDNDAVERMDLVEPTLPNLVKPERIVGTEVQGIDSEVDFAMLGQRPPSKPAAVKLAKVIEPNIEPDVPPYLVAMTYISGTHRYAVVDEKFYRLGEILAFGETDADNSAKIF